ncbi:MAG: hypothetical protein K9L30_00120 [Desulfobacterales bacterium]|nr:hypothetical protein [Desulfobacterales bacterium]
MNDNRHPVPICRRCPGQLSGRRTIPGSVPEKNRRVELVKIANQTAVFSIFRFLYNGKTEICSSSGDKYTVKVNDGTLVCHDFDPGGIEIFQEIDMM